MIFPIRGGNMGNPADFRIPDGVAVSIPTDDGASIGAWFLPAEDSAGDHSAGDHKGRPYTGGHGGPPLRGAMIWFHGNAETLAGLAPIFREFRMPGVALLAVEYRGYGAPGHATVDNVERDALAAWEWLAARGDVDMAKVVVYGRSIGSGPAIHLAAARPVAGLIVESGFTTMRALANFHFPVVPSFLAGSGFRSLERIAAARCPVLLIHGDRDRVVPTVMGQALARAAGARGELWIIPNTDHNDTYDHGGEEYVRRVREFVRQRISS
jgi:fermentation-respiration switch protein FrsA (DUF1100 family)